MNEIGKVENIIKKQRYKIVAKLPKGFTWKPDILAQKGSDLIAFLIRGSDTVPEVLIQRIASTKLLKNKLGIYIVFPRKPKKNTIKTICLYGIGIKFINKHSLDTLNKSKDFSSKAVGLKQKNRKTAKMPRTDIFVSSHQTIDEREAAKFVVDDIRSSHRFPVFVTFVEEDSRYAIPETKKCIIRNMDDSEWFIGILAEEFRPIVKYEIQKALKDYFRSSDIFMFVKNIKDRQKPLNKLIEWIETQNTIKYHPYTDVRDFKQKLRHILMLRISKVHKKLGIPFME